MADKTIIIATKNAGKAKEFVAIFEQFGYDVKTLLDYPEITDIPETGETFAENALQKAQAVSDIIDGIVLADDSGLEVEALNGAPGIYSARYAGEHGNDALNNEKLLNDLKEIDEENRIANFHCTLALVGPGKEPLLVEGKIYGKILFEPRGENGFGYDPLFLIPELNQSMAELSATEKNKISHRAQALNKLESHLEGWL